MTNKTYKSVALPPEIHKILKELASKNNRTVCGQLTHIIQNEIAREKAA